MAAELPIQLFTEQAKMAEWLEEHHASSEGIWVQIAKKGSSSPTVTYGEAVELGLCFGWIDSQMRRLDEEYYIQRFTPRRPRSRWSKINREKAEALIRVGNMRPSGLAEVEAAKADGRWERAYEGQASAEVPPDLQRALDTSKAAAEFFAALDSANRYAIVYRLEDAKKPETRERRLRKFIAMLERGEKIHG